MTIGERIKNERVKHGMSQDDIAKAVNTTRQAIYKYENGIVTNIPMDKINMIADFLSVTPAYLMGWEESTPKIEDFFDAYPAEKQKKLPVYGAVSAGKGVFAEEDIIGYEYVDEQYNNDEYFYLQVQGSSMSPRIENGDLVLVHKQSSVDSGSVGVFLVDDTDGFIKKVEYDKDNIYLISFNNLYPPMHFQGEDVLRVRVLGLVVELKRKF